MSDLEFELDDEFKNLFTAPGAMQDEYFDQTVEEAGCALHKLWVWDEGNILIDGYRRLERCLKNGLEFQVERLSFPSKEEARFYVIRDQLSRRNLTPHEVHVFGTQLAERFGNKAAAAMVGTSVRSVKRSRQYVKALDEIGGDWPSIANSHHRKIFKADVVYLAANGSQEDFDHIAKELIRTDKGDALREWVSIRKTAEKETEIETVVEKTKQREETKEKREEKRTEEGGKPADPSPVTLPEEVEETVPVPAPAEKKATRGEVDKALAELAKMGGKYMKEVYRLFDMCGEVEGHRHTRATRAFRDIVKTLDELEELHGNKTGAKRRASHS